MIKVFILGAVLMLVSIVAVFIAYWVGKDHGGFESDTNWRLHHETPWNNCIGKRIHRLEQQVAYWQGKWAMVKQENNQLRKRVQKVDKRAA